MNFKTLLKGSSLAVAAAFTFVSPALVSCSNDDDVEAPAAPAPAAEQTYADNYFSLDNASFVDAPIPSDSDGESIQGLSLNNQALTGGMNFVTIQTEQEFSSFLVGVKDQVGYWSVDAQQVSTSRAYNSYVIPVNFGTDFDEDFTMVIVAVDIEGKLSSATEAEVLHVDSKLGALNINLTFSNEKDVDLHLYTPSGMHIYYANRGGVYEVELADGSSYTVEYGLDHDSNAGCSIDYLNNENIFLPAELIEPGEYTIKVDLWSNCDPTIPTSWAIVARYNDRVIIPTSGANPASGVYPVDAPSGDHTQVMTFTLIDAPAPEMSAASRLNVRQLPLTESALNKLAQLPEATLKAYGMSDLFE